jgi:putative methyltransferase (TIGR04325 family)
LLHLKYFGMGTEEPNMGLGGFLPPRIARRIVPLLPARFQRFTRAASWEVAEMCSIGYAELPVRMPTSSSLSPRHLSDNEIALVDVFRVVVNARASSSGPIRVVDLGGFDGKHAELVQLSFPGTAFEWVVVDLPAVVAEMTPRQRPGLEFTADLEVALNGGVDVCLASASLNYVPNPDEMLRMMCEAARHVLLVRIPLWPITRHTPAIQRVQRRPIEVSYPTWFFSQVQFLAELNDKARILLNFECPHDRAYFDGHYSTYRGLLLETNLLSPEDYR